MAPVPAEVGSQNVDQQRDSGDVRGYGSRSKTAQQPYQFALSNFEFVRDNLIMTKIPVYDH